jgi:hypothetical protein
MLSISQSINQSIVLYSFRMITVDVECVYPNVDQLKNTSQQKRVSVSTSIVMLFTVLKNPSSRLQIINQQQERMQFWGSSDSISPTPISFSVSVSPLSTSLVGCDSRLVVLGPRYTASCTRFRQSGVPGSGKTTSCEPVSHAQLARRAAAHAGACTSSPNSGLREA